MQHRAALPGAGREDLRDGRSPQHQLGQPQYRGRMRGAGADRWARGTEGLAAEPIRRYQLTDPR